MIQIDINMPIGCIYEGDNGKTEYCPLCNHDDVPYCQYLDDDEAALGIDERPCYCPLYKSEPQWIPVSEGLPEEAGAYLCTCKDAGRLIITLIKWQPRMQSWNLTGARTYWKVIAWMPLPEPWKGEEE